MILTLVSRSLPPYTVGGWWSAEIELCNPPLSSDPFLLGGPPVQRRGTQVSSPPPAAIVPVRDEQRGIRVETFLHRSFARLCSRVGCTLHSKRGESMMAIVHHGIIATRDVW